MDSRKRRLTGKISDLQNYDREADLIVPILIGKTV